MAAIDGLTAEESESLNGFLNDLREAVTEWAQALNHARALDDALQAYAADLLAKVDARASIANTTGFRNGATSLTLAEVKELVDKLVTVKGYDTDENRQLMTKAVGSHNMRAGGGPV